jgi:hypothetical protein
MTSMLRLWLVVFNRDRLDFGGRFRVDITQADATDVFDLKIKVKDMIGEDLSHIHASELTIWRRKDRKRFFVDEDTKVLFRQIRNVFFPEEIVESLSASQKLADLHISEEETLLVETPSAPGTSRISTAFGCVLIHAIVKAYSVRDHEVHHEFEAFYLHMHAKGEVTERDIELNGIVFVDKASRDAPGFVREHENMLGQKRKVSDEVSQIYILSTFHTDDEVRCVRLPNIGLAMQLQKNTLIIQQSRWRTLSPFQLLAKLNAATLAGFPLSMRQSCGAFKGTLEDISSQ